MPWTVSKGYDTFLPVSLERFRAAGNSLLRF
jgi:hypothetical protein